MNAAQTAGKLAFDILNNEFHLPLVDNKANRDNIEEQITIGILSGELKSFVTQDIVDLAIDTINDLLVENGVEND
jgi:hypothetical protein